MSEIGPEAAVDEHALLGFDLSWPVLEVAAENAQISHDNRRGLAEWDKRGRVEGKRRR